MNMFNNALSRVRDFLPSVIPRIPYRDDSLFGLLFFLFLVMPLIFIPVIDESFETPKMSFYLIMMGAIICLFVYKKVTVTTFPKLFQISLLLFVASIVVSTIFSLDLSNSVVGMMGRPTNSALYLITWVTLLYILRSVLNLEKSITLIRVVVFTGFAVAVYSVLQQQGVGYYGGIDAGLRSWAPSFLGNPNFNSMFLAMIVPLSLYCFSVSKAFLHKALYAFSSLLMIWAAAQSTSRAAILSLVGALVLSSVILAIKRRFGSYLIINVVSLIFLLVTSYLALNVYRPDSLSQSIEFQETNQQSRLLVWDMSQQMIRDNPWTGTGLSNFFIKFSEYGWSSFSYGERYDDPHNIFLLLGINGGILLLLSFLMLLGVTFYYGFKHSQHDSYHIALLSSITAWVVAGSFGPVVLACWTLLAFLIALTFLTVPQRAVEMSNNKLRVLIFIAGIIVTLSGVVLISSYVLLALAKTSYERGDYQQTLERANLGKFWGAANSRVSYYQLRSLIKSGAPAEVTEVELQKDIQRKVNAPPSYVSAASIYWHLWKQTGDAQYLDKMDSVIQEAIRREPNYSNNQAQFAYLYFNAGQLDKALYHQRLSLTYRNDQFYGWVMLAKIYYDLNQREEFLFAYSKAASLNRDNFLVKGTLQAFHELEDIQTLPFPAVFPEPE